MTGARRLIQPLSRLGTLLGGSDRTAIITGSPRLGTTWLLEMVERAAGARRIWEPFHTPDADPSERNFGLGWRPYLSPEEENTELEQFLCELLSGKNVSEAMVLGSHQYGRLQMGRRLASAPATVVKFCRLQRLLPWFVR